MRDKRLNIKWARKILASNSFVVLTDRESFIAMDGVDPTNLNDMLILQAQQASIDSFIEKLKALRKEHERQVHKLGGTMGITRSKRNAKATGSRSKSQGTKSKSTK